MHIQRLWMLLAVSALSTVLRQVFPFFWSTFTVKIAVSLHSTHLLTSLIVQNLPRRKVFGGRWSRALEGLITSSLQVARLLLKNTLRRFLLCVRHGYHMWMGSKEWRSGESARLPPVCPGFKSRRRRHMWVEFVVGSLVCSERFFSGYSGFPLSSKTSISVFQFDQEPCRRRTILWMCYLQIIIHLFIIYLKLIYFLKRNSSLYRWTYFFTNLNYILSLQQIWLWFCLTAT